MLKNLNNNIFRFFVPQLLPPSPPPRQASPKFNPYNIRWKGFMHKENQYTNVEWEFRRNIMKNTDGCILFDSSKMYNSSDCHIRNDAIILEMIRIKLIHSLERSIPRKLLHCMDRECVQQSEHWTTEQNLFVLDIWDSLQSLKLDFFYVTPTRYLKHLTHLPTAQILQLLHYLALSKQQIDQNEERDIIEQLDHRLDVLTLNEASFFYAALIRCNCLARDEYVQPMKRFIGHLKKRELREENGIAVSCALKAVRRLTTECHVEDLKALQRRLVPLAKRATLFQLTHFAQLGLSQRVFNPKLLESIIERALHFIRTAPQLVRMKDIERILLAIATFRMRTLNGAKAEFCQEVQPFLIESLQTSFPLSLVQCIACLAIIGTVDPALIDWALKYGETSHIFQADSRHFLVIDSFAKVNLRNSYRGHLLSDGICSKLESKADIENSHTDDAPYAMIQNDLMDIFEQNNHHALCIKCIPHFIQPDLVFIYNTQTQQTHEIVQPNQSASTIIHATELYAREPNVVAVAIVTYGKLYTLYSVNSRAVIGRQQMKMDQLKLLGFHVVAWNISSSKWNQSNDLAFKQSLLRDRLWIEQILLFDVKK